MRGNGNKLGCPPEDPDFALIPSSTSDRILLSFLQLSWKTQRVGLDPLWEFGYSVIKIVFSLCTDSGKGIQTAAVPE